MGFKREGAYAGIEDHVPNDRYPPPPLGLHVMKIKSAINFESQNGNSRTPTTVVEMQMVRSETSPEAVGQIFSWVRVQDARFPGYYLGAVRGFVAAALGKDIGEITGDVASEAINEREGPAGTATGRQLGVLVTPNEKKPEYPKVQFGAYPG